MAKETTIQLYYSSTASAVPSPSDLQAGELAVNTADERIYLKNSSGSVVKIAGDVKLANWQIIESGGVLYFKTGGVNKMKLDSSGNLTVVGNITAYGTIT